MPPARRFTFPNWPLAAVLVWAVALGGVAVSAYLRPASHSVFPIYANAARGWAAGQTALYDYQPDTAEVFRYSPTFALATLPFAVLPPAWGNALFTLLNGAAFAGGVWAWLRWGLPWTPTPNQLALMTVLAGVVGMLSLATAQANLVMTALVLVGLTAVARERWRLAGFAIAAAALVKVYPLALGLVLAVVYWRRFPLPFAAGLVALLAVPFLTRPPEYVAGRYAEWWEHVRTSDAINQDRARNLAKLCELAGRSLPPDVFKVLAVAGGGAVLVVALIPGERRARLVRVLGWYSVWALLYGPGTENATYATLAPSLVEAVVRHRHWAARTTLGVIIAVAGPANTQLTGKVGNVLGDQFGGPALAAVAYQVWLVGELVVGWRRRGGEGQAVQSST